MGLTTCPTRERLAALVVGDLSGVDLEAVAGHVDACPHCRALLQTVHSAPDPLLDALRRADRAGPCPAETGLAQAVARFQEVPPPGESARSTPERGPLSGGPSPPTV